MSLTDWHVSYTSPARGDDRRRRRWRYRARGRDRVVRRRQDGRQRSAVGPAGARPWIGDAGRGGYGPRSSRRRRLIVSRRSSCALNCNRFSRRRRSCEIGSRGECPAMEGKFYRYKTPNHPHTNMAKASLNMLARTCGADLAKRLHIYMTAADTAGSTTRTPLPRVPHGPDGVPDAYR